MGVMPAWLCAAWTSKGGSKFGRLCSGESHLRVTEPDFGESWNYSCTWAASKGRPPDGQSVGRGARLHLRGGTRRWWWTWAAGSEGAAGIKVPGFWWPDAGELDAGSPWPCCTVRTVSWSRRVVSGPAAFGVGSGSQPLRTCSLSQWSPFNVNLVENLGECQHSHGDKAPHCSSQPVCGWTF